MKDKLIFDVSDANTILDSDSVGAFVRAEDGSLVTHSRVARNTGQLIGINDGFFMPSPTNSIEILSTHPFRTGDAISFQEVTGTLPSELTAGVIYYVIRVSDVQFKLAGSQSDAYAGTEIAFTAPQVNGDFNIEERDVDKIALDVSIVDGLNVEVDLSAADDSVASWTHDGSGNAINSTGGSLDVMLRDADGDGIQINADGSINITDNGGSLTVDAVDLDIRDLTAVSDSVQSHLYDGAGTALTSTLVGADQALDVNIVQQEDAALANGTARSLADTLAAAAAAESVTGATAALAGRKYLFIRNNDNRVMYVGGTDVDKDNGFPVSPGSVLELRAGDSIDIYYDSEKSGHAIRTLELS